VIERELTAEAGETFPVETEYQSVNNRLGYRIVKRL
jgi:hypothetical protein